MTNAKPNDNGPLFRDTADDHTDDELSTEELDNVAGGVIAAGPEAMAGKGRSAGFGPEVMAGKGRFNGPESDKGRVGAGPEKSA